MKTESYARSVVSQILYGSAPWRWLWPLTSGYSKYIWEGYRTFYIKTLIGGWFWHSAFDRIFTHMFKLWKLRGTR